MDGVDVDIEWNLLPAIGNLYTPFVVELKEALHAKGKTITTALHAVNLHPDVTQESLEAYDYINIMGNISLQSYFFIIKIDFFIINYQTVIPVFFPLT